MEYHCCLIVITSYKNLQRAFFNNDGQANKENNMKIAIVTLVRLLLAVLLFNATPAFAAQDDVQSVVREVKWVKGPSTGQLGEIAEVRVPSQYVFANGTDTQRLMESMHNLITGKEIGFLSPNSAEWFMVFEFDETGYVPDSEKNDLDGDAMLKTMIANTEESNKERAKRGWAPYKVIGWHKAPYYDQATHNLEWALILESEGKRVVNWNTRLLGRSGVMRVTLVADPSVIQRIKPQYTQALADFSFKKGHQYEEFRQGDKMAEYGLTALVVGGATAAAVKTGAFKWLWKLIVVAFGGISVLFKKLFSRKNK